MRERTGLLVARFVGLLFGGLYAGFLLCVLFIEIALPGFSPEIYVHVQQVKHTNLNLLAIMTLVPAIASAIVLLALLRRVRDRRFVLIAVGLTCLFVALATTLIVNVPINTDQLTWSPQAPPTDWMAVRDRWVASHALRTGMALASLVCLLLAVLLPGARQAPRSPRLT